MDYLKSLMETVSSGFFYEEEALSGEEATHSPSHPTAKKPPDGAVRAAFERVV